VPLRISSSATPPPGSPVVKGLPLVGVLPQLLADPPGFLSRVAGEHPGAVVSLKLGPIPIYLASHPEHAQYVFNDNARNFTKGGDFWKPLRRLFGDGLAMADGEPWLRSRRLMQPLFTAKHIASLVDLMVERIASSVIRVEPCAAARAPLDMGQEMMRLAQAVVLKTVFGTTVDPVELDALGDAVFTSFQKINRRIFLYFLPGWAPLPGEEALVRALEVIDASMFRLIRERRRRDEDRVDLLSLLLRARDAETGEGMSDQQVRDELVTLFVTGSETTAAAMTWVFHLLDEHPEVEGKLRAELRAVLGGRRPTFADLANLLYNKMVIQEALRLYPPAWFIPRVAQRDDMIGPCPIPAGATVLVSPYVTHRDPTLWARPAAFEPERFHPARVAALPRYAYYPFGGGGRQCIGAHFALTEAQLILAMYMQRYRLSRVSRRPVEPRAAPGLWPRHGMTMIPTPV
jgi:cytochrome P450